MWEIDVLPKSSTFDPNHFQKLSNQIKSNKDKNLFFFLIHETKIKNIPHI